MRHKKHSNSFLSGDTSIIIEYKDQIQKLPIKELKYRIGMKIKTHKGFREFKGIKCHGVKEGFLKIELNDGVIIKGIREHRVLLKTGDWSRLDLLLINTKLEGDKRIINITECKPETAYGVISVEETESYYSNGIISHNCSETE